MGEVLSEGPLSFRTDVVLQFNKVAAKMAFLRKNQNIVFPFVEETPVPMTRQIRPFLLFMKLIGKFPATFRDTDPLFFKGVHYRCEVTRGTFVSFVTGLFIACTFALGVLQGGSLGIQIFPPSNIWPDRSQVQAPGGSGFLTPLSTWILISFEVTYTVVACVEYIIAWFNYSKLCQWLNNWNEIEIDLRNKERQKIVQFNITTQVKWLGILYIAFPAIVFGTMITESDVDIHYPAWTMLCISYSYISTMCIFAEDAKILLMLHIINCAFKEVRYQIERWDGETSKSADKIKIDFRDDQNTQQIRDWQRILIKIRKQAELAGEYMSLHQLLSIAVLMYFASAAIFVTAEQLTIGRSGYIYLVVTFTALTVIRLYTKVGFAVKSNKEEKQIVSLLKDMETLGKHSTHEDELSKLYNLLVQRPTEMSLNGYISLNNSLLLTIFGQVLTQFIVLMQFQNQK